MVAAQGKFDPDGKYFYFTTTKNGKTRLFWIDLKKQKNLYNPVDEDVYAFEVTSKGNVYYVTSSNRDLMFYDRSSDNPTRIQEDVEAISMRVYTNTLYFYVGEGLDIYTTKEGSDATIAKFGSDKISAVPLFMNSNLKNTYAGVYDLDNDHFIVYYTSNGKSFKVIGSAADIFGLEVPVVEAPDVEVEDDETEGDENEADGGNG
jgi:dipeptidyl aminopeptidase/acylaminoacyl peptidase